MNEAREETRHTVHGTRSFYQAWWKATHEESGAQEI